MEVRAFFVSVLIIMRLSSADASSPFASKMNSSNCGLDQIHDEIVETCSLAEACPQNPKNPKSATDFNGGGIYGEYEDDNGALIRGSKYILSKEQKNSHGNAKFCFYNGCRRLAVSEKGLAPSASAQHWNVCLNFKGGTSVPHKKSPGCPIAIKVYGKFRELIENKKGSAGRNCCYEIEAPTPPR